MDRLRRYRHLYLVGIVALALLLRLSALIFFPQPIQGDSPGYDRIARNFLAGKGFVEDNGLVAHRTPLYPFMLAALYTLFNHNLCAVYLVQILMDLFCLYLTYRIARKIFEKEAVALLSALFYAFYPTFIINSITLLTETLFTLLVLLFIFALLRACDTRSFGDFWTSGLLLAASALCRPVTIAFLPVLVIYLFYRLRALPLFRKFEIAAVTAAGFLLIVLPWGLHNYRLLGVFVPSTTATGHHFFYAQTPLILERDPWGETTYPMYYEALEKLNEQHLDSLPEAAADKRLKTLAVAAITEHPFQYASMSVNRFVRLWFNVGYGYPPSRAAWFVFWGQLGIVIVACLGYFILSGPWRSKFGIASLLIVYFTLVHALMHAAYRYIVPVMPLVLMLCAYTGIRLWELIARPSNAVTARG